MNSARRFATALHRCRHPLRLGGQQWRRRERRRQRPRRRRRRQRLAVRRSSRRRYRSSTSSRSKVTSHGPADVEGAIIARDAPAQVDNRGRRRDGDLVPTIVRVAFDRALEGRLPDLPAAFASMRRSAGGLRFPALADALGAFWNYQYSGLPVFGCTRGLEYLRFWNILPRTISSAPCSQLRRRFFCGGSGIPWLSLGAIRRKG